MQRPVILPPLVAGSDRCSVKPASRRFCQLQVQGGPIFRSSPRRPLPTWNGQASKGTTTGPGPASAPNIHTTLMPPLGLQARATELSESMLRRGTFKLVSLSLEWRGGTKQRNRRLVSGSEAASFFFSRGPCRQKSVAGDCIDGLVSVLRSSFLSCVGVF